MKLQLPQYNGKDNLVMVLVVLPVALIVNSLFFGTQYFRSGAFFLYATSVTCLGFTIFFIACGLIAVSLKKHYPHERQLIKRISIVIATFLLMSGLFMYFLFKGYEAVGFFGVKFHETGFIWSYFAMGITNIFLTLLMEGIARYRDWKASMQETEKINAAYKQSQLNGLKSQVNPHFLFNSLNSLSSLIQEDEEKAEKFLDEMSKVYRYMLRNEEEQLVTLETELKFLSAYLHLLTARYGNGLQVKFDITETQKNTLLAPLTLQVIIENAFTQNIISKASPLVVEITEGENGNLIVKNNIQPKAVTDTLDFEAGLDNLVKKYELLGKPIIINDNHGAQRIINIPLITNKEEAMI